MANGLNRRAFNQSAYDYWSGQYGVVNVRDFGAVGDGVHDDTAAIQGAVNYAGNNGGGVVSMPPGTYLISSSVAINYNRLLIIGSGQSTRIMTTSATLNIFQTPGTTAIYDINFRDFYIGSSVSKTGGYGIYFNNAYNCFVDRVMSSDALTASGASSNLLHGVGIASCGQIHVDRCHFAKQLGTAVEMVSSTDVWVDDCLLYSNNIGIHVGGNCGGVYLGVNDVAANVTYGVLEDASLNANPNLQVFFVGTIVDGTTTGDNIYLNSNAQLIQMTGGWSSSANKVGLHIGNVQRFFSTGMFVFNNGHEGLLYDASSAGGIRITGGEIRENSQAGAALYSGISINPSAANGAHITDITCYGGNQLYDINIPATSKVAFYTVTDCRLSRVVNQAATSVTNAIVANNTYNSSNATVQSFAGTTAGTVYWDYTRVGSIKKVVIYLSGYENDTTTAQTITFPVPFAYTPLLNNPTSVPGVTVSTTSISIDPNNTTVYSGYLTVEGF